MLIFCQNSLIAPTYLEILSDFKPILISQKEDLKYQVNELLIIDEDEDLCKELLTKDNSPVILFVSFNSESYDDIAFMQKPLIAHTLLQKVQILMQQQEKGLFMNFTINDFTFCGQTRSVNKIPLTQKEAELIEFLYENKGKFLSKEEILQSVFGYTQQVQTHTLETHIYKLRQKIGDLDAKFIVTKDGGYGLG